MQKNPYAYFIGLAMELAVLIVTFLYLGRWVDGYMGWNGFGVAGGAFLGLAIWITHLVSAMNKANKLEEEQSQKNFRAGGSNPPSDQ